MRVLQVVHALPPAVYGGTELYTANLSGALADERGHDVAIATPCGDDAEVPVFSLPDPGPPADAPVDGPPGGERRRNVEDRFEEILDAFGPDVVHFQHFKRLSAGLPMICDERGIPAVGTLHDFWTICHREQLYRPDGHRCSGPESIEKCAACYADAVLGEAASDADRERLRNRYVGRVAERDGRFSEVLEATDLLISPSRFLGRKFVEFAPGPGVVQCRNGIETTAFRDTGFDPDEPLTVGYAGRITEVKGIHLLVDAVRRLDADVELHVFGEFDLSDEYHRELKRRADERTTFHGWYEDPATPYETVDVLALPALWYENSPLVIQEAFAAGLPVVAADVGGMAELVDHDKDGLHFRAGDVDSLADRLRRLARTPSLVERLRRNVEEPKALPEHAGEIEALYEAVLTERPADDALDAVAAGETRHGAAAWEGSE